MREIKGGGRITVCRPAHDRQSSSEDFPEPVSDRPPGRVKQHAWPRETHDASHLFPHGRPVTMNGTAAATRFRFAENASVQPVVRIPDQGGAFGARYRISLILPDRQLPYHFLKPFRMLPDILLRNAVIPVHLSKIRPISAHHPRRAGCGATETFICFFY